MWTSCQVGRPAHVGPDTKAIVVNLPHNPTGYLMPHETFAEVVDVARSHGLILFSDEVYRESEYSVEDRLPAACGWNVQPVSTNGRSTGRWPR
jgi:aspartate/methionine/tyrosine aminotransferase